MTTGIATFHRGDLSEVIDLLSPIWERDVQALSKRVPQLFGICNGEIARHIIHAEHLHFFIPTRNPSSELKSSRVSASARPCGIIEPGCGVREKIVDFCTT